jgi:hypothetical protein
VMAGEDDVRFMPNLRGSVAAYRVRRDI